MMAIKKYKIVLLLVMILTGIAIGISKTYLNKHIIEAQAQSTKHTVQIRGPHDSIIPNAILEHAPGKYFFADANGNVDIPANDLNTLTIKFFADIRCGQSDRQQKVWTNPTISFVPSSAGVTKFVLPTPELAYDNEAWIHNVLNDNLSDFELNMARAINDYRASKNLPKLRMLKRLNYLARRHAFSVNAENILSHCNKDGVPTHFAGSLAGLHNSALGGSTVASNLGWFPNGENVEEVAKPSRPVETWEKSPGHKALLDSPGDGFFGVSVIGKSYNMYLMRGVCQDFDESERNACEESSFADKATEKYEETQEEKEKPVETDKKNDNPTINNGRIRVSTNPGNSLRVYISAQTANRLGLPRKRTLVGSSVASKMTSRNIRINNKVANANFKVRLEVEHVRRQKAVTKKYKATGRILKNGKVTVARRIQGNKPQVLTFSITRAQLRRDLNINTRGGSLATLITNDLYNGGQRHSMNIVTRYKKSLRNKTGKTIHGTLIVKTRPISMRRTILTVN